MRTVSIAVVLILIVLGALGFLFKGYFDQKTAAEAAAAELASNQASIVRLGEEKQSLEAQIQDNMFRQADLEQLVAVAGEKVPARMSSTSILREVLSLCDRYSVTALPLNASDWAAIQIQKQTYYVYKLPLQLSGTQTNLMSCLQALQNELYPTLVIENMALSQPPETELATVNVNIAVYAR